MKPKGLRLMAQHFTLVRFGDNLWEHFMYGDSKGPNSASYSQECKNYPTLNPQPHGLLSLDKALCQYEASKHGSFSLRFGV